VKQKHTLKDVPLTVIPYYEDFEELQESRTKGERYLADYYGEYHVDPIVMTHIMNKKEISKYLKTVTFDMNTSRLYFTRQFQVLEDATKFQNCLKEYLASFVKKVVKIPKDVFVKVQEAIEAERDEFDAEEVDFLFEDLCVTLVGKRKDVARKKQQVEAIIDRLTEGDQIISMKSSFEDKNKLKFLNFIDYFKKLRVRVFPEVKIHGTYGISGNLVLLGTADEISRVKVGILEDLLRISEIEVKMSDRQVDFLQRTKCEIVNNELKKHDAMLMLVGNGALEAKIFVLKKCGDDEVFVRQILA
jgi:hypothetical protein